VWSEEERFLLFDGYLFSGAGMRRGYSRWLPVPAHYEKQLTNICMNTKYKFKDQNKILFLAQE